MLEVWHHEEGNSLEPYVNIAVVASANVLFIYVGVVAVNFFQFRYGYGCFEIFYSIPMLVFLVLDLSIVHSSLALMINNNRLMCVLSWIFTSLLYWITISINMLVCVWCNMGCIMFRFGGMGSTGPISVHIPLSYSVAVQIPFKQTIIFLLSVSWPL